MTFGTFGLDPFIPIHPVVWMSSVCLYPFRCGNNETLIFGGEHFRSVCAIAELVEALVT
jgi:hypothetical protein